MIFEFKLQSSDLWEKKEELNHRKEGMGEEESECEEDPTGLEANPRPSLTPTAAAAGQGK